ncbi:MAG: glycosyltransferase [Desulfobacterota bacterium]|nr:glycosyltransferase [Thermodesulfobacteriota bacterium]
MRQYGFIFCDTSGRRWRLFRNICLIGVCTVIAGLVFFVKSLIVCPRLSHPQKTSDITRTLSALHRSWNRTAPSRMPPAWMKSAAERTRPDRAPHEQDRPIWLGFYAGWDPAAYASLQKNGELLTHIAPEWFSITGVPPRLSASPDEHVVEYAQKHGVKLLPQLTNMQHDWEPEAMESLLSTDRQRRQALCEELVKQLLEIDAAGVVVDVQAIDPSYRDGLSDFLAVLGAHLHDNGLELWLCIPPGNSVGVYDLERLATVVDRFIALLYDENGEQDEPGPIASMTWFRTWLDVLTAHGDPQQWIVGIGSYGYDWKDGEPAQEISFADAMACAVAAGAAVQTHDQDLIGPHFAYAMKRQEHTVWFLDAVTFFNQLRYAVQKDTGGIALYRIGCEDPGVWNIIEHGPAIPPEQLTTLPADRMIAHIGDGDYLTVLLERVDGQRDITVDTDGFWHHTYRTCPRYPLVMHQGADDPHMVALTFDDGPDPEWTPQILDVLKAYNTPAAFFVTGINARDNPDLIRRIVAEGHELGNHTYNHLELTHKPKMLVQLELNATQRIIEGIVGRSTILFRPPYNADRKPGSIEEIEPLAIARARGYVTVSASIDSEDWNTADPEVVFQRVKQRRQEGAVVLLHDAGGDRSATVAALPRIIEYLRRRGDRIVPLSHVLAIAPESPMPPVRGDEHKEDLTIATIGFRLLHWIEQLCWAFMIVSTGLIVCRTLVLLMLAWRHRRRLQVADAGLPRPVSVVIAAHNEERVIGATVRSVLTTTYPAPVEVIVIDDGSSDATASIVQTIADNDPRVRLLQRQRQGKAAALNAGIAAASYAYIVMLDADTQLLPDTLCALLRPFADPRVGAVSGHVRVGNAGSWLTRLQELEYICGFNLDRRAYDMWNCVTVVPGALSAFRKQALQEAGGISDDTIAEDTDLTLTLHRLGYSIRFAADAWAFTEAPDTVRGLVRQRIRWAFGTLQCLCKHHDLLGTRMNKALGFFSIPSVWLFHFVLVAIMPCVDIALLVSLTTGAGHAVVDYACAFLVLDVLLAVAACSIDGTPLYRAWRILPMRLVYRPVLAWAVWISLLRALKGVWVTWGRQERRGLLFLDAAPYRVVAK